MSIEQWKNIPGKTHQVSNLGNVKNIKGKLMKGINYYFQTI